MQKQRKRERYTGAINIGDRVAFIMPGSRYVTAGKVVDISPGGATLTIGALSGTAKYLHSNTLPTVLGGTVRGPGLTLTIQRGLVVENKTQPRRDTPRRTEKGRPHAKHDPSNGGRTTRSLAHARKAPARPTGTGEPRSGTTTTQGDAE